MKQYVLDEPGARPQSALSEASPAGRRWRWAILLPAVGAAALVAVYSVVEGRPKPASRPAEDAVVPVYVAPTIVAEPSRAAATPEPAPAPPEPSPSRITHASGRYVVDLHAAAVGPTLAMLSEATHATVTGSDVLVSSPARITTSFVADTPLEAWKGVFGDVASFAMTCGHSSCAVRLVSLVDARSASLSSPPSTTPLSMSRPAATPPPAPRPLNEFGEPVPDN